MTTDDRANLRDAIAVALADAAGADMNDPVHGGRHRRVFIDQALELLGRKTPPVDLPNGVAELVSAYHQTEAGIEAERVARINGNAARLQAQKGSHEPVPDLDHRKLTLLAEDGRRYRVRLPVEWLERMHHDDEEAAQEAAGRPFVRRATTAA